MHESLILDIFYYFCATVVCVPIFKAIGLGSILGYLVSGILLGPHGFSLLHHADNIHEISEIGLIMLLFVIGLELSPARLKHLRQTILGMGLIQFILTTGIFYFALSFFELGMAAKFLIASALSLSSTAIALTYLRDSDQLTKSYGQSSFGILIFQDLIIIPLIAAIPFLAQNTGQPEFETKTFLLNSGLVVLCLVIGKFALKPALHKIYHTQSKEIFMGTCFVLILGAAMLMDQIGLSKALGAFMAGLFLSASDFRPEIQSFSVPLKSMLMGVFFMGFGMEFDLSFFKDNFQSVLMATGAFMSAKFLILFAIGKIFHKDWRPGVHIGLILCQGGEFGFLVLSMALSHKILPVEIANYALTVLTVSVFLAPFLTRLLEFLPLSKSALVPEVETKVLPFPTQVYDVKPARQEKEAA
ncbi:MAG: cation:proton antiporter [Bacteriovoracaceae bacterium]|nr:cation:proton antiporter [Bacteriovoracaceae bacterium]